jgi:glycine betaine catabolism B
MALPSSSSVFTALLIRKISPLNDRTATFFFDPIFHYKPGQSLQVIFPGDDKKRYYAISSSPTEGQTAITVKWEPETIFGGILSKLKVGETIQANGPWGSFGLPDPVPSPLYFLAGGTGITPFRSMIKFIVDHKLPVTISLLHSAKREKDLIFAEDFARTDDYADRLIYAATTTEKPLSPTKSSSRITAEMIRPLLLATPGLFYICGPTGFVSSMEHLLTETLEIPTNHIRREQW